MPSFRRDREEPTNAIVGAARRVNLGRREEIEQLRETSASEWQRLAWRHYDEIGEIKYAYNYFAAIASRVRLYVGYQAEASDSPSPIGDTKELSRSFVTAARYELSKLWGGRGGQPNFIRSAVLNILVSGECYLVGTHDTWSLRSTSELVFEADDKVRIVSSRTRRKAQGPHLPEQAFIARIWRTHPEFSDDADSALKGVRTDCSELLLLSRIIRASAQSRLNAGLLYVADELRFQRSQDIAAGQVTPNPSTDPFEEELTLALTEPIGMTDSPSEIVPMIIRGPAAFAEKGIVPIDLSRTFDETLVKRHDQTLQRVLNGLDIPRDLVTGLANVRYSNAKSISEDMLKAHVEPIIVLICEAITMVYLRERMRMRGYDDAYVNRLHTWYDPSEVVVRPDRSEDADKGYSRMLVSAATWRRSHGFSETDKPGDDELALRIALSGSVAPSTTLDFLRKIAPEIVKEAEKLAQESFGDPSLATNGMPVETPPPADPTAQPAEAEPAIGEQAPPPVPPAQSDPPEGTLPPREQVQAAQVIDIIHALTAATTMQSKTVRDRTRRLERSLEVERRLRESLSVHLNDIVRRSLERAGARTVSKIRNSDLKSLVTDVSMESVFAAVPESRLGEFALNPEKLVRDTIEKSRATYAEIISQAQDQGWRALGDDVFAQMKSQQAEFIERSWKWLVKELTALAVKWLKNPKKTGNYVTMTVVRDAQTLAGGGTIIPIDKQKDKPNSSGKAILSPVVLDATEWEFSNRYRWVYGVSENSYEPHVKLDDTVFSSWSSDELSGPGESEWPFVTHHFPGDHDGCRCDWLPEVLDPKQVNAPVRGQTWDDAPLAASASGTNGHTVVSSSRNGHRGPVEMTGAE